MAFRPTFLQPHNHNSKPNHHDDNQFQPIISNIFTRSATHETEDIDVDTEDSLDLSNIPLEKTQLQSDDFILSKAIEEYESKGLFMLNVGKTPRDNERQCYAGLVITNDKGFIEGNQLVFPGGKTFKLSAQDRQELAKLGLFEGEIVNGHSYVAEQTAWWAEKSKRILLTTHFKRSIIPRILIFDHLGKNIDLNWTDRLGENRYATCPGAAGETAYTQPNDMQTNAFYTKGLIHLNNKWAQTAKPNTVPSIAECVKFQMKIFEAFNKTETCVSCTKRDYVEAGYCLSFTGEDMHLFLKRAMNRLTHSSNKSFIAMNISPDIIQNNINIENCDIQSLLNCRTKTGKQQTTRGKRTAAFNRKEWDEEIDEYYRQERVVNAFIQRKEIDGYLQDLFDRSESMANDIADHFKWNTLSDEGKMNIMKEVTNYCHKTVGDHVATVQTRRESKFKKHFFDNQQRQNEGPTDEAEGGLDLTPYLMSNKTKFDYIRKNLTANGLWKPKTKGRMKRNKKSMDLTKQRAIDIMFKEQENTQTIRRMTVQRAKRTERSSRQKRKTNSKSKTVSIPRKKSKRKTNSKAKSVSKPSRLNSCAKTRDKSKPKHSKTKPKAKDSPNKTKTASNVKASTRRKRPRTALSDNEDDNIIENQTPTKKRKLTDYFKHKE